MHSGPKSRSQYHQLLPLKQVPQPQCQADCGPSRPERSFQDGISAASLFS